LRTEYLFLQVIKSDPLKRKTDSDIDDDGEMKKLKVDVPVDERIKMATIPFWNTPYEEQVSVNFFLPASQRKIYITLL
jgi:hypothetical protein